ncbi:MAG: protein kinase domain-containing protein, partial [Planctomycetota bacterium]
MAPDGEPEAVVKLTPKSALGAGRRTGPGCSAAGCPGCGTVYEIPSDRGPARFLCPCGAAFTLEELTPQKPGATIPKTLLPSGPGPLSKVSPPVPGSEPDGAPDLDAVRAEIASGAKGMQTIEDTQAPVVVEPSGEIKRFGKYEIIEEVARGGMGIVYRARQAGLNREVALKMLLSGEGAGEDQIKRFLREAESAARLSHPNIVPIFDVGEVDGRHYYTMEFIRGESVAEVIDRMEMIPPRTALKISHSVALALHFAHESGILHRDIKPPNIMLSPSDDGGKTEVREGESVVFQSGISGSYRVWVTDFGLAKDMSGGSVLTLSGTALGTPVYMSPEQADGNLKAMGPASDVYSLGAVLYEMVTGQEPFQGTSVGQILAQVIGKDPTPPRKALPGLHRDVETIILTAMAKEPHRRYTSAQALADDIESYLKGEAIQARPGSLIYKMSKKIRRNKGISLLAFLVFAVLIGAVVYNGIESSKRKRDIRRRALAHVEEGRQLLEEKKYLEAEAAFRSALTLVSDMGQAEEGVREAKLTRLLDNSKELLDDKNYKAAGFVLQEAQSIAPKDPEVIRLQRLQRGTATLEVKVDESGWMLYLAPLERGIFPLPGVLPSPAKGVDCRLFKRLGSLPYGPVDRSPGDVFLVFAKGDRIVDCLYTSIGRNAEVALERKRIRVDLKGEGDYRSLSEAAKAAPAGAVIEIGGGV